jgi:type I restriction enzyme, S subunit
MPEELPTGWVRTTLGEVCAMNPRVPFDESLPDQTEVSFVPMAAVQEESGRLDASETRELGSVRRGYTSFIENDVIFAKITPCMENGKIAQATGLKNGLGYGSTEFFVFRPYEGLLPRFILYFLLQPSLREEAERQMAGASGQKRVPAHYLLTHEFLLPPTREQERIVAKLDAALSRLERAEIAAHRAQQRLKRYRAAVLQAATTGELTRSWREENKADLAETGDALLHRLLATRRAHWEEAELKRFRSVDKKQKDEKWKSRYEEPPRPDTARLSDVPPGWAWVRLQQLGFIVGGLTKNPRRTGLPLKLPYLRVANVYANELRLEDVETIGVDKHEIDKLLLEKGDLLVVEGNGSKDQIGRLAIWDGSIDRCVHQNHIIKVRLVEKKISTWVLSWLLSPAGREHIERVASSTTGLYTLSISKVGDLPILLPPIAEQTEIVLKIEQRFAAADRLAVALEQQLVRSGEARHSLLHEAFTGRLVPQDPTDEPASALLDHILLSRETQIQKPRIRRMPKPASIFERKSLLEVLREHKRSMTPEELFSRSGYQQEFKEKECRQEVVDKFYDELRQLVGPQGPVVETRPDRNKVLLEAKQ